MTTATTLARGKVYVAQKPFDLLLLDLSLPDAEGIEAIHQMHCAARDLPIIALSTPHDEKLAVGALREGAQDYIVKAETDRSLLMRVVRYALERHRLVAALQSMALMDTLTGLYNRRGFVTVAEEQLKLARRTGNCFAIAFVDLDGMKRINDEMGHEFGDQALATTASILKSTFRASDIIARLGGDEFIALAIGAKPSGVARIRKRLNDAAALCIQQTVGGAGRVQRRLCALQSAGLAEGDDRDADGRGGPGHVRREAAAPRQPDVPGTAAIEGRTAAV